ncbi:hypothetical protein SAMN05216390_11288 [Lachnospiraceae bacterium KH1T2]|nr:hypothetical protein SAMN05216390_11288 [Lachnospiraceae bacterium KH1T2]
MPSSVKVTLENKDQIKHFININMRSNCEVDVANGQNFIDGKSIVGLMTLNLVDPLDVFLIGEPTKVKDVKEKYQSYNLIYNQ